MDSSLSFIYVILMGFVDVIYFSECFYVFCGHVDVRICTHNVGMARDEYHPYESQCCLSSQEGGLFGLKIISLYQNIDHK